MKRVLFLVYGVACYLMFLAVYAYMAAFVGDLGQLVPRTIDAPADTPLTTAVTINLLLVSIFALQHSLMARPAFKRVWTRVVPQPIERSTYVLVTNVLAMFLIWQWRPMAAVVWDIQQPIAPRQCGGCSPPVGWRCRPSPC